LNAVALELREPLGTAKFWRHEKDVAVMLGARHHFDQIESELPVVGWVHGSEGLSANQAVDDTHDVEWLRCVRAGRQMKASGFRVQLQQLASGRERNRIGPGLVNLLDHVKRVTLDRVKADAIEFHVAEEIDRITGLRRDPGVRVGSGLPDLAEMALDVFHGPDQHSSPCPGYSLLITHDKGHYHARGDIMIVQPTKKHGKIFATAEVNSFLDQEVC